jgi:dihydrofolate synthase/folylpolyglutamate synthase
MNYDEVIRFLFSKRPTNTHNSVETIREIARELGSPETAYPTIHVTGTNGKGSVSLKIAKALESSGLKVGLFTSPHLITFCERIVINGIPIPEETVRQGLLKLFHYDKLIFFELATLLAFQYFRDEKVDIAVIEAGIGGLLDTTNIIQPLVSIITSVARDHEDLLGQSLEEIAYHKAGIIKPGIPVVIGSQADFPVIRKQAQLCKSPLYKVEPQPGFYDLENAAIARQALEILKCPPMHIEAGLKCRPSCRFEQVGKVIFDVAHNPAGFMRLIEAMELHFPGQRFSAIIGMSIDKDIKECLSILSRRADHLYLVQAPALKAASVEKMSSLLRQDGFTRFTAGLSIPETVEKALASEDLLVVCGSFYIMKEVRDEVFRVQIAHDQSLLSRT